MAIYAVRKSFIFRQVLKVPGETLDLSKAQAQRFVADGFLREVGAKPEPAKAVIAPKQTEAVEPEPESVAEDESQPPKSSKKSKSKG